jgi:hypothetical protein
MPRNVFDALLKPVMTASSKLFVESATISVTRATLPSERIKILLEQFEWGFPSMYTVDWKGVYHNKDIPDFALPFPRYGLRFVPLKKLKTGRIRG